MLANSDCELLHSGLLDQPVNAITSLAFVAVAVAMPHRPVLGGLAAATGLGSFLFHGVGGFAAEWAHNVTIAFLLAGLVAESHPRIVLGTGAALGALFWAAPSVAEPVTVGIAVVVASWLALKRRLMNRHGLIALVVLGAAAVVGILTRTGGPMCDPASVFQGHGVWHVGAAVALLVWSRGPVGAE